LIQYVDATHNGPELTQRHGAVRELGRNVVRHVDADADAKPLEGLALPPALAQDARDLAVIDEHIVRPLESRPGPRE